MQVHVRGKGVVVTDALRDYADRKVNKLTKHFSHLKTATVTEAIEGRQRRVEVLLEGDGILVRCEDRGDDLYAAVDRVVDKLERQMQKHKERSLHNGTPNGHHHHGHHHHYGHHGEPASLKDIPVATLDGTDFEPVTGKIVRTKRFAIKPISSYEAVEQMELLSHDFFVFENSDTGQVNVLYRRGDGNYGILEPER
jgi:putative sigma-54 modulation protein